MKQHRKIEEIYTSLCNNIKRKYASQGEYLTDKEAIIAANNLLGFFQKFIEIKSR